MRLELNANDCIDIYLRERNNNAYVEIGIINKDENEEWISSVYGIKIIENIKLVDIIDLLGYDIHNIEDDIINYFNNVDAFIRVKKFLDTKVIYSFLKYADETEIASSTDFMDLILNEVFKKENSI